MNRPEIEGIKWITDTLVEVVVPMFFRRDIEMGLSGEIFYDTEIIDLTRLACIRDYHPDDNDLENYSEDELDEGKSINEVLVDIDGVNTHAVRVKREDMLQAWLYVKSLK